MNNKRILTVQDISCVGQCSLTVALPILSAAGLETAILPSAVLSTHTAGFTGYTFRDLTDDMPAIAAHWKKEGITFDAIYTGYLGSARQIEIVKDIIRTLSAKDAKSFVDPAMADNGKLYPGFDRAFVEEMKKLAFSADFILPNLTEAAFLTDTEYDPAPSRAAVERLIEKLQKSGAGTVILTGVGFEEGKTGIFVAEESGVRYYEHRRIAKGCHGTGDIYSSAFVGAYLRGKSAYEAAGIAGEYTVRCIECTGGDPDHWYGSRFEPVLPDLIDMLK